MNLSINPTYYCNFRCKFCYLTSSQLGNHTLLRLDILEERLKEVLNYFNIEKIDLYGGEIGLLKKTYIDSLYEILLKYKIEDINLITNLSMMNDVILKQEFYLTISYDFETREQHERVWKNLLILEKPFSILILANIELIKKNVDEMINQLNLLRNLISVEIKPYSTNQSNCFEVSHRDYENFVKEWIDSKVVKKFQLVNENRILESLAGTRNAFSNDHIYLTPTGDFAVLEFDLNDREYFKTLSSIEEYIEWADNEPNKNVSVICKTCKYYGNCLTEHYRYVKDLKNSCNGYKFLLEWYQTEKNY